MTTVTIHFDFSDDSDDCNDFDASSGLLGEIADYAEEMAEAKSEDCGSPVELDSWEVWETDLGCDGQKDFDDFGGKEDLDDWGEYCESVEEYGEAFILRNEDIDDCVDKYGLTNYEGCWASGEEFVQSFYSECFEIPDHLEFYIDWEKLTRDAMMDYSSYEGDDGYHIFHD